MRGLNLSTGYFRGIPFLVDEVETAVENRWVVHDVIGTKPIIEDMGSKTDGLPIPVTAVLVGADHLLRRDLLEAAFGDRSPGKLIHPTLGIVEVVPAKVTFRQKTRERNYTKVGLVFYRDHKVNAPATFLDQVEDLMRKIDGFLNASVGQFLAAFEPLLLTRFQLKQAEAMVAKVGQVLESAAGLGVFSESRRDAVESLERVKRATGGLIKRPRQLAEDLVAAVALVGLPPSPSQLLSLAQPESASDAAPLPVLLASVTTAAGAMAVKAIAASEIGGSKGAGLVLARSDLEGAIAGLLARISAREYSSSDNAIARAEQLATALTRLTSAGTQLPNLKEIELHRAEPSLLAVYRASGGIEREADFLARNNLVDPAAVPAGRRLDVVSG